MSQWRVWPLLMTLGMTAACTSSDDPMPDDAVEIRITAEVSVCSPQRNGDILSCGDFRLQNADVVVSSGSETVWTGNTDDLGRARARFHADAAFVVTATSPWLPETLTSGLLTADAGPTITIVTKDRYLLTPVPPRDE